MEHLFEPQAEGGSVSVEPGVWCMVERRNERFWVRAESVLSGDDAVIATVHDQLVRNADLTCGQSVCLSEKQVLQVADAADRLSFLRALATDGVFAGMRRWRTDRGRELGGNKAAKEE